MLARLRRSALKPVERHSREGGNPDFFEISWIPAFAGMTGLTVLQASVEQEESFACMRGSESLKHSA
jgi:hypothetical protein